MADVPQGERVSRLPLLMVGALAVAAVLVIIAVAAARSPVTYEDGTPEAAVQDYIEAALDEDEDTMIAHLTSDTAKRCREARLDTRLGRAGWLADDVRVVLEDIEVTGDTADIRVRFRFGTSEPFGSSGYERDHNFTLEREAGEWLILRAGWPYPYRDCTQPAS